MNRHNKLWMLIIILLIAVIVTSSTVIWLKNDSNGTIEIIVPPSPALHGEISINGAVNNPGIYPIKDGDSIESVILAAGGTTVDADLSRLNLHVPRVGNEVQPQKVNINKAEAWLLQSLPGIGEIRAQAIIDYRQQNGLFHNTNELIKVEGLGTTTYDNIKHLIMVVD